MTSLMLENVQQYFRMRADGTTALVVMIRADAWAKIQAVLVSTNRRVLAQQGAVKATFIAPHGEAVWGFGSVFTPVPAEAGWNAFRCQLPSFRPKETREERARAILWTLDLLFWQLSFGIETVKPGDDDAKQLLTVVVTARPARPQGDLGGVLSPATVAWLQINGDEPEAAVLCERMRVTMRTAYSFMLGETPSLHRFAAEIDSLGRLKLSCPGSACCLISDSSRADGEGAKLVPSNIDGYVQLLTFLMALAVFYEALEARQNEGL